MSDDVTRLELDGDDAALERALRELGPLMRRQELLDTAEPNAAFARDLRARLVDTTNNTNNIESGAPDPAFASGLRERLVGGSPQPDVASPGTPSAPESDATSPVVAPIPLDRQRHRGRAVVWVGLAAALVAALAIVFALNLPQLRQQHNTTTVAGPPPLPSLGDITRGFPECAPNVGCGGGGGGGAGISPIQSTVPFSTSPNSLYYGPLRVTAAFPMTGTATLPSYQLDAPPTAAQSAAMARQLGIAARVTRVAGQDALWNVAADGSGLPNATTPLHSLAVSTVTGETIYHDLRYQAPSGPTRPRDREHAIAAARAWLARLGRPGMRLRSATPLAGGATNEWIVEMEWPGVDGATTTGATVTVVPSWHVSEARLWPSVARRIPIKARGVDVAFAAVKQSRVPLAVTETISPPFLADGGSATAKRVEVVEVLTADLDGRLYLVPAYRFSGGALLRPIQATSASHGNSGIIPATWYALVPAG